MGLDISGEKDDGGSVVSSSRGSFFLFFFFLRIEMEERDGMNAWVFLPRCVCHHYM